MFDCLITLNTSRGVSSVCWVGWQLSIFLLLALSEVIRPQQKNVPRQNVNNIKCVIWGEEEEKKRERKNTIGVWTTRNIMMIAGHVRLVPLSFSVIMAVIIFPLLHLLSWKNGPSFFLPGPKERERKKIRLVNTNCSPLRSIHNCYFLRRCKHTLTHAGSRGDSACNDNHYAKVGGILFPTKPFTMSAPQNPSIPVSE